MNLWRKFLAVATVAGVIFHVATYALSMGLGLWLFYLTPEGASLASRATHDFYVHLFFTLSLQVFDGVNVGLLFLLIWAVFLVCLAVSWWGPYASFPTVVRQSFSRPLRTLLNNYLFTLPILTSMLIVIQTLINSLQESHGISTGTVNIPTSSTSSFWSPTGRYRRKLDSD